MKIIITDQATSTNISTRSTVSHFTPPSTLSDKELYCLCQLYGGNAKEWLRKFAGLLPEVHKRELHRRRGCGSIQEFAKKLAGMNERTVNKILNLHERLADKPHLLGIFESGAQGWSKLEAVAFIATAENDKSLAEKVENLPLQALVVYVKSMRQELTGAGQFRLENNSKNLQIYSQEQNPSPQNLGQSYTLASLQSVIFPEKFTTFSFPVSRDSLQKLYLIKHDLEKTHKKTLTWNEVINLWLGQNQRTIIQKVCPSCAKKAQQKSVAGGPRPIPSQIQKLILFKHGRTCVFPGCNNAYAEFHHIRPYAIYKSHDPNYIFPVCSTHHTLFHAGLIKNAEKPPRFWSLRAQPKQTTIDKKVMKFKMGKQTLDLQARGLSSKIVDRN